MIQEQQNSTVIPEVEAAINEWLVKVFDLQVKKDKEREELPF